VSDITRVFARKFLGIVPPLRETFLMPTMPESIAMFYKKGSLVLLSGLLLMSLTAMKQQRIATGVWGGQHINIKVGANSATIEYDCASGVIDGPLVVDSDGNFKLRGTHHMERGGPVRSDEEPRQVPATYTGSIKGNTMTLTLKLSDSDEETFTLERGKPGELFRCK
jgi:hypothetical protein